MVHKLAKNQPAFAFALQGALLLVTAIVVVEMAAAQIDVSGRFIPTEAEWHSWPEVCHARYVDIPLGQSTQYRGRISRAEIDTISSRFTRKTFQAIHHYCYALGYMMRAKSLPPNSEQELKFLVTNVVQESEYTYQRMDKSEPIAADVAYLMAEAFLVLGEPDKGVSLLERVIEAQPTHPRGYVGLALIYRRSSQEQNAFETLRRAMNRVKSPSAELYYSAGLAHLERQNFEVAQQYAVEAYNLGYPLPGLKRKLAEAGYWPPKRIVD